MYLADRLAFVELHKTGCSHILRLLRRLVPGEQLGKHTGPKPEHRTADRVFIGSIRNPWDWYVSLWAYGCGGEGAVYNAAMSKAPERWQACYADVNSPACFQRWLAQMHSADHWPDFAPGYGKQPLSRFAGFMTFRFLTLYCDKPPKPLTSMEALRQHVQTRSYISHYIRNERLEDDFIAVLAACGQPLNDVQQADVRGAGRTNTSARRADITSYHTAETVALITERERLIIELFGYQPPLLSPLQPPGQPLLDSSLDAC